jgi:hypothetical protein
MSQLTKKYNTFYPKIVTTVRSQKYGLGIRDPIKACPDSLIPHPGVKKASDPRSVSATFLYRLLQSFKNNSENASNVNIIYM